MAVETTSLLQRAIGSTVEPPDDPLSERILDAALEISAASGVKNLTMDEVADRAGVGRMTVYRRFGNRERLEETLAVREARRCLAELDSTVDPGAPVADQIAQGLLTSLRLIREHPLLERMSRVEPAAALAALTSEQAAVFAMSRAFVAARIAESQRESKIRHDLDPEQAAEILVRLSLSFLLIPQSALPLDDDERMAAIARTMIAPVLGSGGG
jgi:TetR/AcrR family transcriptional regulator, repressor for uid operon